MEHEERTERLERETDRLEEHSEKVGDHIEDARRDWQQKEEDAEVPGAQPDPAEEEEEQGGVGTSYEKGDEPGEM